MEIECKKCGYEWDYSGESDYYATCPKCHYKVNISAKAKVVPAHEKKEKYVANVKGKAVVLPSDARESGFTEKEYQFLNDLKECKEEGNEDEIFNKYDEEEFNALIHKVKEKARLMRDDLKRYEKAEKKAEDFNWDYKEM